MVTICCNLYILGRKMYMLFSQSNLTLFKLGFFVFIGKSWKGYHQMWSMWPHLTVQGICQQASINHFLGGRIFNFSNWELTLERDFTSIIPRDMDIDLTKIFSYENDDRQALLISPHMYRLNLIHFEQRHLGQYKRLE